MVTTGMRVLPAGVQPYLNDPPSLNGEKAFCIWRSHGDASWQIGTIDFPDGFDPDGSEQLLKLLDDDPASYQRFVEEYLEKTISVDAIAAIYRHTPLTLDLLVALGFDSDPAELKAEIDRIGYPCALPSA